MVFLRLLLACVFLMLVGRPTAQPSGGDALYFDQEIPLPVEWSPIRHFDIHGKHLLGLGKSPGGALALHVCPLPQDNTAPETRTIVLEGLDGEPAGLATDAAREFLLVALQSGREVRVHRAQIQDDLTPGAFRALPSVTLDQGAEPAGLALRDGVLYLRTRDADGLEGALFRNDLRGRDPNDWSRLPAPDPPRRGGGLLLSSDGIVIAGGESLISGEWMPVPDSLFLDPESPEPSWQPASLPLPPRYRNVVSVSEGVLHAVVMADGGTAAAPLSYALETRPGEISAWRRVRLGHDMSAVRGIAVEPATSRLVLVREVAVAGEEQPRLRASLSHLPPFTTARPVTEEDLALSTLSQRLRDPERWLTVEEALQKARDEGRYALVALSDGSREQDIRVRGSLASTVHRHMAGATITTYVSGEPAEAVLREFRVDGGLPAFLLIDPIQNRTVRTHTGTIPRSEDFFRLTSPSRQP